MQVLTRFTELEFYEMRARAIELTGDARLANSAVIRALLGLPLREPGKVLGTPGRKPGSKNGAKKKATKTQTG